jgi:RimJ/RimL family protein N-acetyltransferase
MKPETTHKLNNNLNKKDIKVLSACDVDEKALIEFYRQAYPGRLKSLSNNWRWINRTDFHNEEIPLILKYNDIVIGHSGIMPFNFLLNGLKQNAGWFIDFKLLDEFQRQGYGTMINARWMEFPNCALASPCNSGSIAVFTKAGWEETPDTYMHYQTLNPFNHPKLKKRLPGFICRALNLITKPVIFLNLYRKAYNKHSYELKKIDKELFDHFYETYKQRLVVSENTFVPVRDNDYVSWRVLNSPNFEKYFIYKVKDFQALVLPYQSKEKIIDILWVSDTTNYHEIIKMIATLGVYGLKKGYAYTRFYTTRKDLSARIKQKTKSVLRHPRFAYFLKDKHSFNLTGELLWDLQLLDNDFEKFH